METGLVGASLTKADLSESDLAEADLVEEGFVEAGLRKTGLAGVGWKNLTPKTSLSNGEAWNGASSCWELLGPCGDWEEENEDEEVEEGAGVGVTRSNIGLRTVGEVVVGLGEGEKEESGWVVESVFGAMTLRISEEIHSKSTESDSS